MDSSIEDAACLVTEGAELQNQPASAAYVPVLEYIPLAKIVSARTLRPIPVRQSLGSDAVASSDEHDDQDERGNRDDQGDRARHYNEASAEGADGVTSVVAGFVRSGVTGPADAELAGLARSLGPEHEPRLAEPPVVEEQHDGTYRLCAGERRIAAARLAGWRSILCLVYPALDPGYSYTLGLLQNAHHAALHPLDEMAALCISRLLANLDARGMSGEARQILLRARIVQGSNYIVMSELQSLLSSSGWLPARPDVTWKAHLDDLGISMAPWERKRKLRILNIEPDLQQRLRNVEITEAALRSLGTLEPDDQRKVVFALEQNPLLARKVRRVARSRRSGFYSTIEDALAEVQGLPGDASLEAPAWHSPSASSPAPGLSRDRDSLPSQYLETDAEAIAGSPPFAAVNGFPTRSDVRSNQSRTHAYNTNTENTENTAFSSPIGEAGERAGLAADEPDWVRGTHFSREANWVPRTHFSSQQSNPDAEDGQEVPIWHNRQDVPAPVQDAVLQLLECADKVLSASRSLQSFGGGAILPDPWRGWWQDAKAFIEATLNPKELT